MLELEMCCECDDPTGYAGIHDDSYYCACGKGPFCDECWASHQSQCDEAEEHVADCQTKAHPLEVSE